MTLGDRIKQRREEKKISAADLAKAAGVSKGYLSEIETGRATRPSGAVLLRLARELGTTIADLLDEEVRPQSRGIHPALQQFATEASLPQQDIDMLSQIRFRGEQPSTVDDWRYLYESIKRTIPKGTGG